MRRYSQANLLNDEMQMGHRNTRFLDKAIYKMLKQTNVIVHLDIPNPIYFRAEIFCEDIQDLSEMQFDHNDLLNLLYHDFLLYIKKNPDPQALYNLLIQIDRTPAAVKHYNEETPEYLPVLSKKRRTVETSDNIRNLSFRMKRKQALRGEVLLADLSEVYPDHQFTLEGVLEMLYIDFVEKLKRGDNPQALNNIVKLLCEDE